MATSLYSKACSHFNKSGYPNTYTLTYLLMNSKMNALLKCDHNKRPKHLLIKISEVLEIKALAVWRPFINLLGFSKSSYI